MDYKSENTMSWAEWVLFAIFCAAVMAALLCGCGTTPRGAATGVTMTAPPAQVAAVPAGPVGFAPVESAPAAGQKITVEDPDMGALSSAKERLFANDPEMRRWMKHRRILLPKWWTDDQKRAWWIAHKKRQGA